jgi:hypothetical protein
MTRRSAEPERELVRRALPFALPALPLALVVGALAGGWNVGWSAAIGIGVVLTNFVAHGLSLARAARVSVTALFVMAIVGVVVRMGAIIALIVLLRRFAFFSTVAFGLAVVPGTILLLTFELRLMATGIGRELVLPGERGEAS